MKYIVRTNQGTKYVNDQENIVMQGMKQFINTLCVKELSTFEGRSDAAKIVLNKKSIVPIFVNKEVLLFPTESIRNQECIYVNFFEVLCVKETNEKQGVLVFRDLSELQVMVSKRKLKRQMKLCEEIIFLQGL